jgi:flavin-dependent dehydrogenase
VVLQLADGGEVRARWVVAADGMWSPMRKFVGAAGAATAGTGPYLGEWHAFRQYLTGVGEAAATDLYAWFEPDFLPGYAWSFPLGDGSANVGFGILRGGRWPTSAMKALWPEILARPHIRAVLGPDARPEGPHKAWPIPAAVGAVPLTAGRVLFAGDAASLADPLTGEGIGQALASGRWAAEAILEHGLRPHGGDGTARAYEISVRHHLGTDHALAAALSRALSHRKGARSAIWLAGLSPWTRRNFARWLFEDYPRAILATPSRWHRGMFTGPGTRF